MENIFITAIREKYRFAYHGSLSVEDLWDLTNKDLDAIFKSLNRELKKNEEESLFSNHTKEDKTLANKIKIVSYIFTTKQEENEKCKANMEKKKQREQIAEILAKKKNTSLENKSVEELTAMLSELTDED